ncbi:MAG TPA: DUF2950 family protein [Candidatus Dormibacteraeota bacterium]|nr:DUF2950 family protein [Candidatus Dormibacteraeota bacterium]
MIRFSRKNNLFGEIVMHTANIKLERVQRFSFFWLPLMTAIALFVALIIVVRVSLAQEPAQPAQPTYASAEQATQALYDAVRNDNEQVTLQILGGQRELTSSGDELEDKAERKQFATKYQEMHRLVRQSDGTVLLYIGAENWPFPVPLVAENAKWRFDPDAAGEELLYRRIGENETVAIRTSHALVRAMRNNHREPASDDIVKQYAFNLANAKTSNSRRTPADPFYGYFFRKVSNDTEIEDGAVLFVAYPAGYRSSGVMTFIVTSDNVIFEKDLGPKTARFAKSIGKNTPDLSWHLAE